MSEKLNRILVVDDDEAIRVLVERVLRRERFDVDSARDGFEAIEKLSKNDYQTILLDMMMPPVDGHGVLRFLEKHLPEKAHSVIIMTANVPSGVEAATRQSIVRVLAKPFDIQQLVSNVRDCGVK